MKPTTFLLASVIGAAQLLPLAVSAQPNDNMERASILFGAFITDRDSSTRLDSDSGEGTDLDLEDDLGLESSTSVARLGGYFWLGRRHRIDARANPFMTRRFDRSDSGLREAPPNPAFRVRSIVRRPKRSLNSKNIFVKPFVSGWSPTFRWVRSCPAGSIPRLWWR